MRIDIRGVIVPNEYGWYYDFFGVDNTTPDKVRSVLEEAAGELVEVYISSPGGEITSGSEIYTMLRKYQNIRIYITGQACSAASVIAMAGYCEMSPTALMMVHCASTSLERGNHSAFEHTATMLTVADEALSAAYTAKSGMLQVEVLEMMEKETWLTAEKAVELGLVDAVMQQEKEEDDLKMSASLYFKLPSEQQLEAAKKFLKAPSLKDKQKLQLLKLKGGSND